MKKIAILSAMSKELDQFKDLYPDFKQVNIGGIRAFEVVDGDKHILLTESGMGKVCAATNAIEIIREFKPDMLINSGCAGSLSNDIEVKDVVISTGFSYHDVWFWEPNKYGQVQGFPAVFKADEKLLKVAQKTFKENNDVRFGLVCTGDKFISHPDEIQKILGHFPDVLAVDMEATAVAQVCYMYKTPFLSLKVISDNPVKYPNGYKQYNEFWSQMADTSFGVLKKLINEL